MTDNNADYILKTALETFDRENTADQSLPSNTSGTKGKWLEHLTTAVAPFIKDWDIAQAWQWNAWPDRHAKFPELSAIDPGIDVVARTNDGDYIAIQCKARKLNERGHGSPIHSTELNKFNSNTLSSIWAERWLATNGDNDISVNALMQTDHSDPNRPIKHINVHAAVYDQRVHNTSAPPQSCPHCQISCVEPDLENPPTQTKDCMQQEAVKTSVDILRKHVDSTSGGLPKGQARGKLILPCGTGKTRVSLRILEELTPIGQTSLVLCPSIALVAQIRREYLQNAQRSSRLRALAVCSDQTAGYDPKKEDRRDTVAEPTLDVGNVNASSLKGKVTTEPKAIADWIQDSRSKESVNFIFGTYQSGSPIAEALKESKTTLSVIIADEAHRTAGIRLTKKPKGKTINPEEQVLRDFTLCHDNNAFPAAYRIYQTATPRTYEKVLSKKQIKDDYIVRDMNDEVTFGVELYRKSYVDAVRNNWLSDYRIIAVAIHDETSHNLANDLAKTTTSQGRRRLTTTDYLRGLALAITLSGAATKENNEPLPIKSCIGFMNTVDGSKTMARDLDKPEVQEWLKSYAETKLPDHQPAQYSLAHLDATSSVAKRDEAKTDLANATEANPHCVMNVGIFGEGTDSPSLSAVAFLNPRKSPFDVIQITGRAMRTAADKEFGYIICPIVIPPDQDPETFLSVSNEDEGWQELGQLLPRAPRP